MEVCECCPLLWAAGVCALLLLLLFTVSDRDFTLLWAEKWGTKPDVALRGKVVWITGASSGIGEELAYQLAAAGARLVLSARREAELERVKQNCLERSSLEEKDVLVLPLDLLDKATHQEKTNTVMHHFGNVEVLINNGGRSQRSLCVDTDVEVYQGLMELNFIGTVSITKQVLPHMIRHGNGIIATVSSIVGLAGAPLSTGYSASKHALQGFFNSLRTELSDSPGITISTILPGPVVSQIVQNAFTEHTDKPVSNAGDQTHKMSTERCVRLIMAGLANQVKEMWIAQQPFLLFFYIWQYTPTFAWFMTNLLGRKRVQNFKAGLMQWGKKVFSQPLTMEDFLLEKMRKDADSAYFTKPKAKTT